MHDKKILLSITHSLLHRYSIVTWLGWDGLARFGKIGDCYILGINDYKDAVEDFSAPTIMITATLL